MITIKKVDISLETIDQLHSLGYAIIHKEGKIILEKD